MPTLIAIVVSCIVFALFIGLLLMFCRCKRKQTKKSVQAKDYEMDSVRPSIVAQQNQAPPPYYPASGLENKALEHSMDLALAMEDQKTAIYATQNGYGYHTSSGIQVPSHTIPGECKFNTSFTTIYLNSPFTNIITLNIIANLWTNSKNILLLYFFNYAFTPPVTHKGLEKPIKSSSGNK